MNFQSREPHPRLSLPKYGIPCTEQSDIFVGAGKICLGTVLSRLPPETGHCVIQELQALDALQRQMALLEQRIQKEIALTPSIQLLKTLPGVGNILPIVIQREIGSIQRFNTSGQLTSYAGLVPTVHASGGIDDQVSRRKGHAVAVGAVARHLAEGAFWILKRQQPYRPPANRQARGLPARAGSPKQVRRRA